MKKEFIIALIILNLFLISKVDADSSAFIINHSSYTDSINYYVVGEVKNTGAISLTSVKVTAVFYDKSGQAIDASYAYTHLTLIPMGDKSSFQIVLKNTAVIPKIDSYILSLDYKQAVIKPYIKLNIQINGNYTDNDNFLHIIGEVENQGSNTRNVNVIFTGYNYLGEVVLTTSAKVYFRDLKSGETTPFDLMIISDRVSLIEDYILIAESDDYHSEVIPEFLSPIIIFTILVGILLSFKYRFFSVDKLFNKFST